MTNSKQCTACGITKPLDDYSVSKRGALGRDAQCRACKNAKARKNYKPKPTKQCTKCEEVKSLSLFPLDRTKRTGRASACKACKQNVYKIDMRAEERDRFNKLVSWKVPEGIKRT